MNITMSAMQVRELCVKNDWFTCGDNSQYEKLFERVRAGAENEEIATIIWICSENVTQEEIVSKLTDRLYGEYAEFYELIVAKGAKKNDRADKKACNVST